MLPVYTPAVSRKDAERETYTDRLVPHIHRRHGPNGTRVTFFRYFLKQGKGEVDRVRAACEAVLSVRLVGGRVEERNAERRSGERALTAEQKEEIEIQVLSFLRCVFYIVTKRTIGSKRRTIKQLD